MTWMFKDATAIAGIGETAYTKAGGTTRTELDLACEAISRAVADAGLTLRDVDGLSAYSGERATLNDVAQTLSLGELRYAGLYPGGGNSATGVVHNAAVAVGSGTATTVVCYRSICQGQHLRFGRARAGSGAGAKAVGETIGGAQAFTMPFGLMSPAQMYALDARRHMHEYGTTSAHFGRIAVACYAAAQRNPRAVMRGRPLTLEMHQASRMIADPYRLYDCCQESDGACALVVTSKQRAALPVLIAGAAQCLAAGDVGDRHRRPEPLWSSAGMAGIADTVYANAGIGPEDIDVAQLYENFTGQVLMALEDFGFCKRGEGG